MGQDLSPEVRAKLKALANIRSRGKGWMRHRAPWLAQPNGPEELVWRANLAAACLLGEPFRTAVQRAGFWWSNLQATRPVRPTRAQTTNMLRMLGLDWGTFSAPLHQFVANMRRRDVRPAPPEWNPRVGDFYRRFR